MYTLLKKAVLRHYFTFTSFFGQLFLVVKRNFNTCFHPFLNKFVKTFTGSLQRFFLILCFYVYLCFSLCFIIYLYCQSCFVRWFTFSITSPNLISLIFSKFDVVFFSRFFVLLFYWRAAGALEMKKESLLILLRIRYKFQRCFFSPQTPIYWLDCSLNEANLWEERG